MDGPDRERQSAGFRERTRLATARETLRTAVCGSDSPRAGDPTTGTESVDLAAADGRILAERIAAERNVPHYERAAMDGYAVRAADTHGASGRSPAVLTVAAETPADPAASGSVEAEPTRVDAGTAVRVHTGSALPEGADAVVKIEHVTELDDVGELEVDDAVAAGENVAPVGEDVAAGATLYEPGHRLRPSDLGLLRSTGVESVTVARRPTVAVQPTGEELVGAGEDPAPGQVVETNGLTVTSLVERWGGRADHRDPVTDDEDRLRTAIADALDRDVVVTTGGSSVGERDLIPEVIDDLGDVLVHGVALKPGHPVCLGIVEGTPVLALPGYPVACIINAVQFLRPTLSWLVGTHAPDHPTVTATLERKIPSEPGTKTFARVELARDEETDDAGDEPADDADDQPADGTDGEPHRRAIPTRASGSGVLSSVALADGWVVVPESREGVPAGERVAVELWE